MKGLVRTPPEGQSERERERDMVGVCVLIYSMVRKYLRWVSSGREMCATVCIASGCPILLKTDEKMSC